MNTPYQLNTNFKAMLQMALPLSFGAFIQFIVVFTDNFFIAKINGNAMSAVALVGLIYITLMMFGVGLGNAVQIIIARRVGEDNRKEVGLTFANSLWIALIISIFQFLFLRFATPPLLNQFIRSEEIRMYMREFIDYRSWGFFFYMPALMFNSFWSGIARTRIMTYETVITGTLNIVFDYGLIFGNFGLPTLGVEGAAIANTMAEAVSFSFIIIYTFFQPERKDFGLFDALKTLSTKYTKSIIKLALPIALQGALALIIWVIFYDLIEKLGEQSLQSSLIIRNMYMLVWVSVMGFSTTTKTYVSGLIAEKRLSELRPTIKRLMTLNFLGIVILSHGLWLYPEWIAGQFTSDPEIILLTVKSMHVVLPAMFVFSVTSILLGAVEGSGNAVAGFIVELLTTLFYLTTAFLLAVKWTQPVYIVWMADYVYFIFLGVLSLLFLRSGKWKYKVI